MDEILNISIKDNYPEDKRKIGRSTGSMSKIGPYQWPRFYGKTINECVKAKHWELRNYLPKVVGG